MPLYEYQCEDCAHRFEELRKFSDPPLTTCPECRGPVRKLPSSPAIQFKGSGWYITDYARKPSGGQASETSPETGDGTKPKDSESSSEKTSADSTPDTKTSDAAARTETKAPSSTAG